MYDGLVLWVCLFLFIYLIYEEIINVFKNSVVFGLAGITYQILMDIQNQLKIVKRIKELNSSVDVQYKEYLDQHSRDHLQQNVKVMEKNEFTHKIEEEKMQKQKEIQLIQNKRRVLFLEFLKAFFDLPVAFEATYKKNYLNTDVLSLCGMISSLVGLYVVLPKMPSPPVVVIKS